MPFEVISGSLGATAAIPTQIVMNDTDSRTIRSFASGKNAWLTWLNFYGDNLNGPIEVKSPKLHDNNLGIHFAKSTQFNNNLPITFPQILYSQDNMDLLAVDTLGAGEWDVFTFEIYYEELIGNMGNYVTWDSLKGKIKNLVTVEITDTPAGVVGYQTPHNLAQLTDLLIGNTNYALLGYATLGNQIIATIKGPMTGNMRLALPNFYNNRDLEAQYFIDKCIKSGFPCIPILNRADVYGTFVEFLEEVTGTGNSIDLIFGQL